MQHFLSKIYNNSSNSGLPIYSILSDRQGFCIDNIDSWKQSHNFKDLFVICNGQQTLPIPGTHSDYIYGRPFTGSTLIGYGTYNIYRKDSLAAHIYDMSCDTSLVVDILSTKFDWQSALRCSMSICYLTTVIQTILNGVTEIPRIWLLGFSRGATLCIHLADLFRGVYPVHFIGLIDPVIAPWRELVCGYLETVNAECVLKLPLQCKLGFNIVRKIPVLRNPHPRAILYNVFQRKSLLSGNFFDFCSKPVGCAVEGGLSYRGESDLASQYDTSVSSHFILRDTYIPLLLDKIENHYHYVAEAPTG